MSTGNAVGVAAEVAEASPRRLHNANAINAITSNRRTMPPTITPMAQSGNDSANANESITCAAALVMFVEPRLVVVVEDEIRVVITVEIVKEIDVVVDVVVALVGSSFATVVPCTAIRGVGTGDDAFVDRVVDSVVDGVGDGVGYGVGDCVAHGKVRRTGIGAVPVTFWPKTRNSRKQGNVASSVGIVPLKALFSIESASRRVNSASCDGIDPPIRLLLANRVCRFVKRPMQVGKLPLIALRSIAMTSRLVSSHSCVGMVPP